MYEYLIHKHCMIVKVLGQKDFLELANHILKGDQLIVRGCDVTTVTSIIFILKVCLFYLPPSPLHPVTISLHNRFIA